MTHAVQEVAFGPRRLRQLPVALDQLAGSQRDLGFQALPRRDDLPKFHALQAQPVGEQCRASASA